MNIREYRAEDCRAILELFYHTVHTVNAADYGEEQLEAWADGNADEEVWNQSFLKHRTYVAEEDGVLAGFGDIDETGYLDRLYVHKDFQRRGIASALCGALEEAVSAEKITTHASITAKPFFEKRGYRARKRQEVERKGVLLTNFVMELNKSKAANPHMRFALPEDAEKLLNIYAQYIDTPITFEYVLPDREAFAGRIEEISSFYPYLVWEEHGKILGYAYAHRQMERKAYDWNAELSIYLDQTQVSKGIGTRLYQALMELLRLQGLKTVYAGVTLPNPKSEGLHTSFGFQRAGVYHKTGYTCGKWQDVAWYEKAIAPYEEAPAPICSIHTLEEGVKTEILERCESCRERKEEL